MESQRDSFVFYRSFFVAASQMSATERLAFYDALTSYALDGTEPKVKGIAGIAFTLCRPQIEENNRRYFNGKKGGVSGQLGGRPKKENPNGVKSKNPSGVIDENPGGVTEKTPNVNVNVNVNDNVSLYGDENPGGVTDTDKKKIFETFFFLNFREPEAEVERYLAWGESTGWKKTNGSEIRDKVANARLWKPKDEQPRFTPLILQCLMNIRLRSKDDQGADAIFALREVKIGPRELTLFCPMETYKLIEKHILPGDLPGIAIKYTITNNNETNGK